MLGDIQAPTLMVHGCAALAIAVADAHIAATLGTTSEPLAVLTSDPDDVHRIADHLDIRPRIVVV